MITMKILVAVDFSPVGREVAHAGYRLAKKLGSEITFFHCAPQTARFLQGYDIKAVISSTGKDEQKKIFDEEDNVKAKLRDIEKNKGKIRLLGVTVSNLSETEEEFKNITISEYLDNIKETTK